MNVELNDLIGKTVERTDYQTLVFTDGTVLTWDEDGCQAIYTAEEWEALP